jgi:hypothetical protein
MVQLHAMEAGLDEVRVTQDIDVLAPDGVKAASDSGPAGSQSAFRVGRRRSHAERRPP